MLHNVAAPSLKIWRISKTEAEARKLTVADLEGEEQPSPRAIVGEYWADLTAEVHVFVANPLGAEHASISGPASRSRKRGHSEDPAEVNRRLRRALAEAPMIGEYRADGTLVTLSDLLGVEPGSVSGSAPESHEREHSEDPVEANKRIRRDLAEAPINTPSTIAIPSNFLWHCRKGHLPRIRCGLPSGNQGPFPLVLAHRIFAIFVSECETYEPKVEDLQFVLNLSHSMRKFLGDQEERRWQFRACMRAYGINLTEAEIEHTEHTTDGDARVGTLPYLISGGRKGIGASQEDPYIRAAAYHLAATQSWLRVHPNDLRALPCLLIFHNGPVVGFAGSMLTDGFDVNVLGPMLPLFYHPTDMDSQIRCAKMFGALKNAATALKEYYEHTTPESFMDTRFPWITQYDTITEPTETCQYEYLRRMHATGLLYLCQHIHDKKRILVKFVRTYSKDAHLEAAAGDEAPALLGYHDVFSCGWSVVVMELLEEPDWVSGLKIVDEAEQRMVYDEVKKHVLTLHERGFVHGDIRPQNIFVRRPDAAHGHTWSVRLIDFDWAGKLNEAKYPYFVNPDLGNGFKRPSSVKGGGTITMEHDLAMLDLMYPALLT